MTIARDSNVFLQRTLICTAMFLVGCGGDFTPDRLPPNEDAFLSYFQSAHSMARLLNAPPPLKGDENRQSQIAIACAELEGYQGEVAALPPEEQARLASEHAALVAETAKLWDAIASTPENARNPIGADWSRIEKAFLVCRQLSADP